MHQTKLIRLLRTLPLDNLQALKEFLESPYFNKNKKICDFFLILSRFAPDYQQAELNRNTFVKIFFPDKVQDSAFIDRLNSQLYKLVLNFISIQLDQKNEIIMYKKILLLDYEIEKGTVNDYKRHIQLLKIEIDSKPMKTMIDYNNMILLAHIEKVTESRLKKQVSFKENIYLLDKSHASNKLPLLLNELNRSQVLNKPFDILSEKNFLDTVLAKKFYDDLQIELYYKKLMFLINPDEDIYLYLKSFVRKKNNDIEASIITNTRTLLINHILKKVREGDKSFYNMAFDFLETEMIERGKLHFSVFANLITVALNVKSLEWVDNFLEENKNNITPIEKANDAYLLNLAKVRFLQGLFSEALNLVSQSNLSDIYYSINSKILKIKINYQLSLDKNIPDKKMTGITKTLESDISSLKTYLSKSDNSQNVPPIRLKSWQNFANLILRLYNVHTSINKHQLLKAIEQRIEEILQKNERISELDWLNQKISAFKKNLRG